ncbi:hypothetical protein BDZ45DRAFT_773826 [Acephala macrosclerotiorum]|nr:hypothetical protein BDZ45DRAFT_773826 [Acephala macrosclerotiorum]
MAATSRTKSKAKPAVKKKTNKISKPAEVKITKKPQSKKSRRSRSMAPTPEPVPHDSIIVNTSPRSSHSSRSSSPAANPSNSSHKDHQHLTWTKLKENIPLLMMEFPDYSFDEIEDALLLSFLGGRQDGITVEDLRSARDTIKAKSLAERVSSIVYMGRLRERQLGIPN